MITRTLKAAFLLCLLFTTALAQDTLRIGVIVPPAGEGPAGELARDALQGATFAVEEFEFNAMLVNLTLDVQIEHAADGEEAVAAADRLAEGETELAGIAGGFDLETATALSGWAEEQGIPFLNLAAPSDSLRGELCAPFTFHVAPSAAMYLDAIGGWYIRANFRDWFVGLGDDPESQAQLQRKQWMLDNRHFGADISSTAVMAPGEAEAAAQAAAAAGSDVVLMLLPTDSQLEFLAAYEAAGAPV